MQSAILDVARNYGQMVSKNYLGTSSCGGANRTLPSGYLGIGVEGYRNGALCGFSGIYYSNVATSAWQLWITLCSNPSGTQDFYTRAIGYGWSGSGYVQSSGVYSPSQNY